jgi:hypothetical protein
MTNTRPRGLRIWYTIKTPILKSSPVTLPRATVFFIKRIAEYSQNVCQKIRRDNYMQAFLNKHLVHQRHVDFIYGTVTMKISFLFCRIFFSNRISYKHKYACYHQSQWLLIFLKYSPTTNSLRPDLLWQFFSVQNEEDVLHGSPGWVPSVGRPPRAGRPI